MWPETSSGVIEMGLRAFRACSPWQPTTLQRIQEGPGKTLAYQQPWWRWAIQVVRCWNFCQCYAGQRTIAIEAIRARKQRRTLAGKRRDIRAGQRRSGLEFVLQSLLLQKRQQRDDPATGLIPWRCIGQPLARVRVGAHRQRELPQVVLADGPASRFARILHGNQQQRNQDGHDSQHHQEFDQRSSGAAESRFAAKGWHTNKSSRKRPIRGGFDGPRVRCFPRFRGLE